MARLKITTVSFVLLAASGAWGLSPEDKCEADKNKIAGKYAFCRQKAEAKAIKKNESPDYTKCDTKLLDKWAKAEQKAIDKGTACIDSIADTAIQGFVTTHADAVAAALDAGSLPTAVAVPATGQTTAYGAGSDGDVQAGAALSFTDNLDGTITDNNTGLMWEKKDDSGGIHDQNNSYTWCDASCGGANEMDGTIATTFLATLNGGGGFAGHTDWRIPNRKELTSILDLGVVSPAIDPAFHKSATCGGCADVTLESCSCTAPAFYWSSTSFADVPSNAWYVNSTGGGVTIALKHNNYWVRAVRGGL